MDSDGAHSFAVPCMRELSCNHCTPKDNHKAFALNFWFMKQNLAHMCFCSSHVHVAGLSTELKICTFHVPPLAARLSVSTGSKERMVSTVEASAL